jgi:hypothetical protein
LEKLGKHPISAHMLATDANVYISPRTKNVIQLKDKHGRESKDFERLTFSPAGESQLQIKTYHNNYFAGKGKAKKVQLVFPDSLPYLLFVLFSPLFLLPPYFNLCFYVQGSKGTLYTFVAVGPRQFKAYRTIDTAKNYLNIDRSNGNLIEDYEGCLFTLEDEREEISIYDLFRQQLKRNDSSTD